MGFFDWLTGSSNQRPDEPGRVEQSSPLRLARDDEYSFEVVGESHRQDVFDEICGGKCDEGYELEVIAQLMLIEDNPYDANAGGVFLNGRLAAYVPRDFAPKIRADILRLKLGDQPIACNAIIVGGWDRGDGDEGHFGLKLSLADPLRIVH